MISSSAPAIESADARDASLDFFKELAAYRGRLVVNGSTQSSLSDEVALIMRLLFAQFIGSPQPTFASPMNEGRTNRPALEQLTCQVLPRYGWADTQAKPQVRPWILDYVYQRWIDNRETGSYFTPDFLAEAIVAHALTEWLVLQWERDAGDPQRVAGALAAWRAGDVARARAFQIEFAWMLDRARQMRIVDLSVGGGAFLTAAMRLLFELTGFARGALGEPVAASERVALAQHIFAQNIFGLDLLEQAVTVARMRLVLLARELRAWDAPTLLGLDNLLCGDSLALPVRQTTIAQAALFAEAIPQREDGARAANFLTAAGGFDLCVGNPPFIALSQGNRVAGKTEFLAQWQREYPDYALQPTSDLSNFFILRGVQVLRPDGILAYITSRNFFDTRYGTPIRRFLTRQVELRHIFTLHEHPFVQQGLKVKANTVILSLARRAPQTPIRFHHLISPTQGLNGAAAQIVNRAALHASANWTRTLFADDLRQELVARCSHKLGDYARVRMGTKTGCNTFFLFRSTAHAQAAQLPAHTLVKIVKNSRDIPGWVLPAQPAYRLLNLHDAIPNLECGYTDVARLEPLAQYIFRSGIEYPCAECQALAMQEHRAHPERVFHAGMCEKCATCRAAGKPCDRPVDRLSTQGHRPEWYTLALEQRPAIAVQCIVDTEIGVFWNAHDVFVTDQFQVIEPSADAETTMLVFLFLTSRLARYILEGTGLHRARYDGSFMLKLQVGHLSDLACPDLRRLARQQKTELLALHRALMSQADRKVESAQKILDDLDRIFLDALGYPAAQLPDLQARLRVALEQAILFRWTKSNMRKNSVHFDQEEN